MIAETQRVLMAAIVAVMAAFLATSAPAADDILAELANRGEIITAAWSSGPLPDSPDDEAWNAVTQSGSALYPQVTAEPKNTAAAITSAIVKAVYNDREFALYLEWDDATRSENPGVGRFADALAVQFPSRFGPGIRLPYIGMGDSGHPVGIWRWRAGDHVETLAAEGFGSLTPQPSDGVSARGVWKDGRWRVVFKRALEAPESAYSVNLSPIRQGMAPVAFAVWNGGNGQRGGMKTLSSWRFLRFERAETSPEYIKGLAPSPRKKGDPGKGKALMKKKGCSDCHTYPGSAEKPDAGPDLTFAGGIHRPEYLLESMKKPSSIVVPGKDYFTMENGEKISLMPEVELSESDTIHILEYLRTLR